MIQPEPSPTFDDEIRAVILVVRRAGLEERGEALRRLARLYGGPRVGPIFDAAWRTGWVPVPCEHPSGVCLECGQALDTKDQEA